MKSKYLFRYFNFWLPIDNFATKLSKTVAKPSYSLISDLNVIQGAAVLVRLASSGFSLAITISLNDLTPFKIVFFIFKYASNFTWAKVNK